MSRIGEKLHLDHQICNVEKQLQELLRCHRRAVNNILKTGERLKW